VAEHGRGRDELIFQVPPADEPRIRKLRLEADAYTLGRNEPNPEGHTYRHGTPTGYSFGRCHCDYCRGAYAQCRAGRRAGGKDDPRQPRSVDTDGHVSGNWFRTAIWVPAIRPLAWRSRSACTTCATPTHPGYQFGWRADLAVVRDRLRAQQHRHH
jgi:hypothetical protein